MFAKEEKGNCSGAGMCSDYRADLCDEFGFFAALGKYHFFKGFCVFYAVAVGNEVSSRGIVNEFAVFVGKRRG